MSPRANHPGKAGAGALGWSNEWLRPNPPWVWVGETTH